MSFNSDFGSEFDGAGGVVPGAALVAGQSLLVASGATEPPPPPPPPPAPTPSFEYLDCPQVEILTGGDAFAGLGASAVLEDYLEVESVRPSFSAILADWAYYASLMEGHAGFSGGVAAPGRGGFGMNLGIRDAAGIEWWVTDLEGWDDGPQVVPNAVDSLVGSTWVDRVRAKGREFTVKGAVLAPDEYWAVRVRKMVAAILGTPPHMGLLRVGGSQGMKIPVALASPAKQKPLGLFGIEFEMSLVSRDIGTPGAGVWREGATREYVLGSNAAVNVDTDSYVSTRPLIRFVGPLSAGQMISDGERHMVLAEPLAEGQVLRVNCANWQVVLDGLPARYMLTATSAQLEIDPLTESLFAQGAPTSGQISVTVTDIY